MWLNWTGYGLYLYFKIKKIHLCLRFIPKFNIFSKDKRRLALWRIK